MPSPFIRYDFSCISDADVISPVEIPVEGWVEECIEGWVPHTFAFFANVWDSTKALCAGFAAPGHAAVPHVKRLAAPLAEC